MKCLHCNSFNTNKNGSFNTPQHGRVQKYLCRDCCQQFSHNSQEITTKEHRPELNQEVIKLYHQGLSEREIAERLNCARLTVRRKLEKYL